jgi:hypothetical protein
LFPGSSIARHRSGISRIVSIQTDLRPSLHGSPIFRSEPVSAYVERSIVEKAVEKGMQRRTPLPGIVYFAFLDSSSGSGTDSYTTAIGHNIIDDERTISVIDVIYEAIPPFDPDYVTRSAATTLKEWNLTEVYGDSYGGAWPVTAMARNGIRYVTSPLSASELYLHTLPLWNAGRVQMLDHAKAIDQLCALRRRVGQGVQEKIVHPRNGHDDLANSVAGVLWRLSPIEREVAWDYGNVGVVSQPRQYVGDGNAGSETMAAWNRVHGYTRAKDGGLGRGFAHRPGSVVW